MSIRAILAMPAAVVCVLVLMAHDVQASWFRTKQRTRVVMRPSATVVTTRGSTVGVGPGGFLASLNAWRAQVGRPPLAWDASLAAAAASNTGVHAPGSSKGVSQVWAPTSDFDQAMAMWLASPRHLQILYGASQAVGASPCPTGITCNAR